MPRLHAHARHVEREQHVAVPARVRVGHVDLVAQAEAAAQVVDRSIGEILHLRAHELRPGMRLEQPAADHLAIPARAIEGVDAAVRHDEPLP